MAPTIADTPIRGKRVLLRVDMNVPISRGRVASDFRIRSHLPTFRALLAGRNTIIVLSHHSARGESLRPVARRLAALLGKSVHFVPRIPDELPSGGRRAIYFIENLRYWPGEERADAAFARRLARLGDCFVNDAFAVSHRRAASLSELPKYLPSCLGLLFAREISELDRMLEHPKRPFIAIFGGAKIETKLRLLDRMVRIADRVLVGGAIANELLAARGAAMRSASPARARRSIARLARHPRLMLPIDVLAAVSPADGRPTLRRVDQVQRGETGYDVGPSSIARYVREIARARSIVWNGPLGLAETKPFDRGTLALARALARSRAEVTVGGGDTVAWLEARGLLRRFTRVSTGGGAMLAYLGGERLPGLAAIGQRR